jgi:hypothetical protein
MRQYGHPSRLSLNSSGISGLSSVTNPVRRQKELVHQPLRMDPAQRMPTDDELTGIIADDDGIAQEAMGVDAAP